MNSEAYLASLKKALANSFDFKEVSEIAGIAVDMYAVLNVTNESYFLTRKIPLYAIKNNEYIAVKKISSELTAADIEAMGRSLGGAIKNIVVIDSNHMSSVVSLVLLCEQPISAAAAKEISRQKYHKDFMFTLRGWADVAIIAIDLPNNEIYTNKFGQRVKDNYKKILSMYLTSEH